MRKNSNKSLWVSSIALFSSLGTLVCCALPALMVSIGAGASLAGFISVFPELTLLSDYKEVTFGLSGVLLLFAAYLFWRSRHDPCPVDPQQAKACRVLRRFSKGAIILAGILYGIGFFFAFIAVHIFFD